MGDHGAGAGGLQVPYHWPVNGLKGRSADEPCKYEHSAAGPQLDHQCVYSVYVVGRNAHGPGYSDCLAE